MAAFDYTGFAKITWKDGTETRQFIDFAGERGTLAVWPINDAGDTPEYIGQMRDHPAKEIKFLHTQ